MQKRRLGPGCILAAAMIWLAYAFPTFSQTAAPASQPRATSTSVDEITALKQQLAEQQKMLEKMQTAMAALEKRLDEATSASGSAKPVASATLQAAAVPAAETSTPSRPASLGQVASLAPVVPAGPVIPATVLAPSPVPGDAPVTQDEMEGYTKKVDSLDKAMASLNKGLAGFKFSGDLRFRTDGILRTFNSFASQQQNVRERYRLRLNINKDVTDQFGFHMQLSTGTAQNPTTLDSDFGYVNTRGPIWLSEYYADYHPNKNFSLRAGKMEEVFADGSKFLFDDDVRFNGMQEIAKTTTSSKAVSSIAFMAGQYILTNPNTTVPSAKSCTPAPPQTITITTVPTTITVPAAPTSLSSACIFYQAGYAPLTRVRDADLFDQGVQAEGKFNDKWGDKLVVNYQVYRNPNQLLIATNSSGAATLVNGNYGLGIAGGVGQPGNGTTTNGGFILTASSYHIGRFGYQISRKGNPGPAQSWPVTLDVQGAHNFGADFYGNAAMAQISAGSASGMGHVRLLYGFFYKQANSMMSEVTDDDIGIGVGTNMKAHMFRFDLGLAKSLQWQNIFYIMQPLAPNDPARDFYVPLQLGANNTYRFQSQFQFSF
jgi:Putative porin